MNPNIKPFWDNIKDINVLYGGRDSSKTKDVACNLVLRAIRCKMRVMCTRQFQRNIDDSVYNELNWAVSHLGLDDFFTFTVNKIICNATGSQFMFKGLQRNIQEIKGLSDIDVIWIEEGASLTQEQFELIEPTIRADGSFMIIVFNPNLVTDYVWKQFVQSDNPNINIMHINYTKNIFLTEKSKRTIYQKKKDDYKSYEHIYLGVPLENDDEAIILRRYLSECVDAHIKLGIEIGKRKRIGYDIADDGTDANAYAVNCGGVITKLVSWQAKEDEIFDSSEKVYREALEVDANIVYDKHGVGAGTGSNIKQLNETNNTNVKYTGFSSSGGVVNPNDFYTIMGEDTQTTNLEYFENRKAQAWFTLRDRVVATYNAVVKGSYLDEEDIFSISSDIEHLEELLTELSTPRKAKSRNDRVMVEKKSDMKKRGIHSPNLADCVVYSSFNIKDDIIVIDMIPSII